MNRTQADYPSERPCAAGWVLFSNMRGAYWHWITPGWTTLCEPTQQRRATQILEWRPEPRGRNEVCPDCRKRIQRAEAQREREREQPEPAADREPEVITVPDPIPDPTPIPNPKRDAVPAEPDRVIPHPQMRRLEQHQSGGTAFQAAAAFAEQHGLDRAEVLAFIHERMPETPRLGDGKKAPYLLSAEARARILAELPAWVLEQRNRKPLSQHEQVMQGMAEIRELLVMLAEDVAKLKPKDGGQ